MKAEQRRPTLGLRRILGPAAIVLAGVLHAGVAAAAYTGTLTFIEPTGTVGPTDEIPVWLRFTLDETSDPLVLTVDAEGTPPFGVPLENHPAPDRYQESYPPVYDAEDTFDFMLTTLTDVFLNTYFGCDTTFGSCTQGPPYDFEFNTTGPDTLNFLPDTDDAPFVMNPGESRDYLFGSFRPSDGPVAPGVYTFSLTGLTLNFNGTGTALHYLRDEEGNLVQLTAPVFDENGDQVFDPETGEPLTEPVFDAVTGDPVWQTELVELNVSASYDLASTAGQEFVRTVVAPVPLPGAVWMLGAGAGLLALMRRRALGG